MKLAERALEESQIARERLIEWTKEFNRLIVELPAEGEFTRAVHEVAARISESVERVGRSATESAKKALSNSDADLSKAAAREAGTFAAIALMAASHTNRISNILAKVTTGLVTQGEALKAIQKIGFTADESLQEREMKELDVKSESTSREPWVASTSQDRVGLALSGGGIRSATFNLGLLQALSTLGVARHIDYLSTVSGGGYLGGFWTAWKQQPGSAEVFPNVEEQTASGGSDKRERKEFRHMREFSRFLSPRVGVNESEMWYAAATVLGGMLPALVATIALIALIVYTWIGIGHLATVVHEWAFWAPIVLPLGIIFGVVGHLVFPKLQKGASKLSSLAPLSLVALPIAAALAIRIWVSPPDEWMPAVPLIPWWAAVLLFFFLVALAEWLQRWSDAKNKPAVWTWGPGVWQLLLMALGIVAWEFQWLLQWSAEHVTSAMLVAPEKRLRSKSRGEVSRRGELKEELEEAPQNAEPLAEVPGGGGQEHVEGVTGEASQGIARHAEVAFQVRDGRFNRAPSAEPFSHGLVLAGALALGRSIRREDRCAVDFL